MGEIKGIKRRIEKTGKAIEDRYKLLGVDVDKIHRELAEMGRITEVAVEIVRRRKNFFQRIFWSPSPMFGLEIDPEVVEVRNKLGYLDVGVEK